MPPEEDPVESTVEFQPRNPDYLARTRTGFVEQAFMNFLGAELVHVGPGKVEIRLPWQQGLTQQHGFFHGGAIGAIADVTGGFAAFSLMGVDETIVTIEYKVNMLAPAIGEAVIARGQVLRAGRRVTVAEARLFAFREGKQHLCATALGSFMSLPETGGNA